MATNTKTRNAPDVRTDAQQQRVNRANRTAITAAEVEQHAATVLAQYGSTGSIMDAHKALEESARTTETGLRAWYPVAIEARAAGITHRAFGEMTGGSKEVLGRLSRGAAILAAFERNGSTVPAVQVQSVANRTTDRQAVDLIKSIKPGRVDQLEALTAAVKAPKSDATPESTDSSSNGGRQSGTPNRRTGSTGDSDWSIDPSQYVKALEIMRKHLGSLSTEEAAKTARALRPVVTALQEAMTAAERKAKRETQAAEVKARSEAESQAVADARRAEAEARTAEAVAAARKA